MSFAKLGYVIGAVLFVLLLQAGRIKLAMLLLGAGVVWGIWRIRQYLAEAREREARQWQTDFTLPLPKKDHKGD